MLVILAYLSTILIPFLLDNPTPDLFTFPNIVVTPNQYQDNRDGRYRSTGNQRHLLDNSVRLLDGEDDGKGLILNGSHGGSLLAGDNGATSEADKDLEHDKVTDLGVDISELGNQANSKNSETHTGRCCRCCSSISAP